MDAGRRTMSALKTSEGGKSSRPDGCSTQCGAQCGALLYPFDRSSASTDDSAARTNATPGRTKDAGRSTMSALKTSEGGKSSRPDECSTHCGAHCGALLYPLGWVCMSCACTCRRGAPTLRPA